MSFSFIVKDTKEEALKEIDTYIRCLNQQADQINNLPEGKRVFLPVFCIYPH